MLHLRDGLSMSQGAHRHPIPPFQLLTPSHPTARVLYTRGALCAPALYLKTRTGGPRDYRMARRRVGGKKGAMSRKTESRHCGRAEPAPPRGVSARRGLPTGVKAGEEAKGASCGVMRSARPRGIALRVAGHLANIEGLANGRWSRGNVSVNVVPSLGVVKSLILRKVAGSGEGGLVDASPKVTRRPVFAEGRGLRVRIARPHARQRVLPPPLDRR